MNSLMKVAICGLFAVTLNNVANAAVLQRAEVVAKAAVEIPAVNTAIEAAGVKVAGKSAAELSAAIAALPPSAQSTALVNALNAFSSQYVSTAGKTGAMKTSIVAQNSRLANSLFSTTSAQVAAAADLTAGASAKVAGAPAGEMCAIGLDPKGLANDTQLDSAKVDATIARGFLKSGSCGEPLANLSPVAKKNAIAIAIAQFNRTAGDVNALTAAISADAVAEVMHIPVVEADALAKSVAQKCGYFRYAN